MIAIVCNIDEHYTDHCIVMCTSAICNNPGEELHFYIIAENLPKQHRQRMCRELDLSRLRPHRSRLAASAVGHADG